MIDSCITPLIPAKLDPNAQFPKSLEYQDVYFNPNHPIEESLYVFIHNTHLERRLGETQGRLRILETGFGTGLNFLLACNTFFKHQQATSQTTQPQLHYITIEKHPLTQAHFKTQLNQLLLNPSLSNTPSKMIGNRLVRHYPPLIPGRYRLVWPEYNISLTLLWQDALEALSQFSGYIDTFFLDGFSPQKNPAMWSDALFSQMARIAAPNANFATFTAAGQVRRGLQAAGFSVSKRPGFQHKREMLAGYITPPTQNSTFSKSPKLSQSRHKKTLVVGAGISGCSTAHRLASAGYHVALTDSETQIAAKASGNARAALQTPLSIFKGCFNEFQHNSSYFSASNLEALTPSSVHLPNTGMIQFPGNPREEKRFNKIRQHKLWPEAWEQVVSPEQASDIANTTIENTGMYYPKAHLIPAAELCQALCQHPNIDVRLNTLFSTHTIEQALNDYDHIILCTAFHTQQLLPQLALNLLPIRGQLTELPCTPESEALTTILSGKNYLLPKMASSDSVQILGATYYPNNADDSLKPKEHQENINYLPLLSPKIAQAYRNIATDSLQGRTAIRTQSRDYLPLVGPIEQLGFNSKVLINCGLGSRGFTHAWICADILLSYLAGAPFAISKTLQQAIHPERFQLKTPPL